MIRAGTEAGSSSSDVRAGQTHRQRNGKVAMRRGSRMAAGYTNFSHAAIFTRKSKPKTFFFFGVRLQRTLKVPT